MNRKMFSANTFRKCGALSLAAIAALVGAMDNVASAASIVFTSRAAFDAATINQQIITFDDLLTSGTAQHFGVGNSVTTGGVTFSTNGPANTFYVINRNHTPAGAFNFNSNLTANDEEYLNDNNYLGTATTTTALLPANTRAVGVEVGYQTTHGNIVNFISFIGLSTGENFQFTLPKMPVFSFIGFISDVPITSITFQAAGVGFSNVGSNSIENFTLAQVPVPEPASVTLVLGAIFCAASALAWRRLRAGI